MGCGSKAKATQQLVQIGEHQKLIDRKEYKQQIKEGELLIPTQEYHCPECGIVLHRKPIGYKHRCDGKVKVHRNLRYQKNRQKICDSNECGFNEDGICLSLRKKYPDLPCIIEIGVKIPYARCLEGHWPRVSRTCKHCRSITFDQNGPNFCHRCKKLFGEEQ